MLRLLSCIVAECATCGKRCWDAHAAGPDGPHFADEATAMDRLVRWGWQVTDDGDLLCPLCAAERECQLYGHRLSDWLDCVCRHLIPGLHPGRKGQPCRMQVRSCARCAAEDTCEERPAPRRELRPWECAAAEARAAGEDPRVIDRQVTSAGGAR
jgi:hypothetical protein